MPDSDPVLSPVKVPAPWRGDILENSPRMWLCELEPEQVAELAAVGQEVAASDIPLEQIVASDYPLKSLAKALADWRERLESGAGMVLVRGLPVRDIGKRAAAAAYWLVGNYMGTPKPQNAQAETLVDIRDTGAPSSDHSTRLYKTRADLSFHTDGADIIGLLCLRAGKSGGVSRICSSVEVYNQIIERRPDLAALLERNYHHHAHGQFGPNGPKTFSYPIVTRSDRVFRMFLLPWYIRNAAEDFPEIAPLNASQYEMLDLLESIPLEPGVALDMNFQEGDMQFLKNSVVLHARTEYTDWDDPDEKRHLLRLWLTAPDFCDGDDVLRAGIGARASNDA